MTTSRRGIFCAVGAGLLCVGEKGALGRQEQRSLLRNESSTTLGDTEDKQP